MPAAEYQRVAAEFLCKHFCAWICLFLFYRDSAFLYSLRLNGSNSFRFCDSACLSSIISLPLRFIFLKVSTFLCLAVSASVDLCFPMSLASWMSSTVISCISWSMHLCVSGPLRLNSCLYVFAFLPPRVSASLRLRFSTYLQFYVFASLHFCISAAFNFCVSL